jgi:AcrR family transcriptional regulator
MASETGTKILNTAERLFAHSGFEGVSLREVGRAAGVNSASVHYHFGSRDVLVEAVVLRRMEPIQRRRRDLLDGILASPEAPTVEDLLGVLVLPLVELLEKSPRAGRAYVRLLSRLYSDRKLVAYDLAMRYFGEVHRDLGIQLAKAIPELPHDVLARRISLCVQTTLATLADPEPYAVTVQAGVAPQAPQYIASELIDFMAGGLRAAAHAQAANDAASAA